MNRFLAVYTVGDETAVMSLAGADLDDAYLKWEYGAAEKHKTTIDQMQAGFEGEPCLCYMVDRNLGVWEMNTQGEWEEADSRAP